MTSTLSEKKMLKENLFLLKAPFIVLWYEKLERSWCDMSACKIQHAEKHERNSGFRGQSVHNSTSEVITTCL